MTRMVEWQNWKGLKSDFQDFRHSPLRKTIYKWRQFQTLAILQSVERFEGVSINLCWWTCSMYKIEQTGWPRRKPPPTCMKFASDHIHTWQQDKFELFGGKKMKNDTTLLLLVYFIWPWKHHLRWNFWWKKHDDVKGMQKNELPWGWHFSPVKAWVNHF